MEICKILTGFVNGGVLYSQDTLRLILGFVVVPLRGTECVKTLKDSV